MAGGLFVFVRTAPPGGCALAITAGQYRPPMAHCRLAQHVGRGFFFLYRLRNFALSLCHAGPDVIPDLFRDGIGLHISELLFGARAFPVAFPRYL